MTSARTTVFLIEASDHTRALVARFLERSNAVQVVGTAPSLAEATPAIDAGKPDVVVVDRLPTGPSTGGLRASLVLHTATVPEHTAVELRRAGVSAIVFKEVGMLGDLVAAIHRAGKRASARLDQSGGDRSQPS